MSRSSQKIAQLSQAKMAVKIETKFLFFWAESDIKINPKSFNLRQRALIKPFVVHIKFGIMKKTVAYFIAFIVSFAVSTLMDYLIGDTVTVGDIATACINGIILLILIEMVVRKTSEK